MGAAELSRYAPCPQYGGGDVFDEVERAVSSDALTLVYGSSETELVMDAVDTGVFEASLRAVEVG